jgi:8-oxo-dGTP diphosphatase
MTDIRHFTASAIVFDDHQRVLLVHHNKLGQWLYPGGHIDSNEDPAQAALREVLEETGVQAEVVSDPLFTHPAVTVHAPPYVILEMQVDDAKAGVHRHIDLVYVLRATAGDLTAQLEEIRAAR